MEQSKADAFAERVMGEINTSMSVLNLYLGHRLGLYRSMADSGPVTPIELADRTGLAERYLREWMEAMATNGYIDYDEASGRFTLSPEHGVTLTKNDDPNFIAPFLCWVPSLAGVLPPLMDAFETGGGVPYEAYGAHTLEAIGNGNRPMFANDLAESWIPAMPDVEARLRQGGRVADIGSGIGWSSIYLAKGYPGARVDGFDLDEASIERARANATQAGVGDRITFTVAAAEDIEADGVYNLVTAFEVIHDMAYPVKALRAMRRMLKPDGVLLVADEAVGDTIEENSDFTGRMMYNFSVLHCLPQAMVFPDGAATGTVMGPSKLRSYALEAGFKGIDVLPIENPFWRFYKLTP
jgi:2-polyprenyl-3-methyl-5-hydroxy-6-metoxy-1,4-benzoquinol methylase